MNATSHLSVALSLLFATACSGDFVLEEGSDFGGGGGASADAAPPSTGNAAGRAFFVANIQPLMSSPRPLQPCALCHQGTNTANGPIFLGLNAEENYQAILDANLLGGTPLESRLYTRGIHAGDAFPANEALLVAEWIRLEASP